MLLRDHSPWGWRQGILPPALPFPPHFFGKTSGSLSRKKNVFKAKWSLIPIQPGHLLTYHLAV